MNSTKCTVGSPKEEPVGERAPVDSESDQQDATYRLDAELTFSGQPLVLSSTVSSCPDVTFRLDLQAATDADAALHYLCAGDTDEHQVETALDADPTVRDHRCISRFDTETIYRVRTDPDAVGIVPMVGGVGGYVRHCRGGQNGWTVRMHLRTRDMLRELNARCEAAGVSVVVDYLSDLRAATESGGTTLSHKQRDLLATANRHGYFDIPRGISQRELASQFGVSPSAISQQLRTAIANLVSRTVAAE